MKKINKKLNLFLVMSFVIAVISKVSFAEASNIESINNIIDQQQSIKNSATDNYYQQQIINNQQTIIQEQQKLIENLQQQNNINNSQQNNQQNQTLISQNSQNQQNNIQKPEEQKTKNNGHWETHLAPIVYYNALGKSVDVAGNLFFEKKFDNIGWSVLLGIYGVYNGVYGNNTVNWDSPNIGEIGTYKSVFSIIGDFGLKYSGESFYGMFLFGVGGGMSKINIRNDYYGGGFKGNKGDVKLHLGFELGYKRFFTRFDVIFGGLIDVNYIDDYGIKRTYSEHRSRCSGRRGSSYSCNATEGRIDLLLGVGMYLF